MTELNILKTELRERLLLRKLQRRYEQSMDEILGNDFEIYELIKILKGKKNG